MKSEKMIKSGAYRISYRKVKIDDVTLFYREAGDPDNPSLLLLHGFPTSSRMYQELMERLAPDYHVIAPDYPGFGFSSCPSPDTFVYSFDHLAEIIGKFVDCLNLKSISFYMQDYGGPVGFRIITKRPELVSSLIIQNANIYLEGLGPDVQKIGTMTAARDIAGLDAVTSYMMSLEGIQEQYLYGASHPDFINPDSYYMDNFFFEQPGIKEIQKILFNDYGSNFPKYPEWQDYLRQHQPPVLITWGKNDKIFPGSGALAYQNDLPDAEIHLFDGGHFLLGEYVAQIAVLIDTFLRKKNVKS